MFFFNTGKGTDDEEKVSETIAFTKECKNAEEVIELEETAQENKIPEIEIKAENAKSTEEIKESVKTAQEMKGPETAPEECKKTQEVNELEKNDQEVNGLEKMAQEEKLSNTMAEEVDKPKENVVVVPIDGFKKETDQLEKPELQFVQKELLEKTAEGVDESECKSELYQTQGCKEKPNETACSISVERKDQAKSVQENKLISNKTEQKVEKNLQVKVEERENVQGEVSVEPTSNNSTSNEDTVRDNCNSEKNLVNHKQEDEKNKSTSDMLQEATKHDMTRKNDNTNDLIRSRDLATETLQPAEIRTEGKCNGKDIVKQKSNDELETAKEIVSDAETEQELVAGKYTSKL